MSLVAKPKLEGQSKGGPGPKKEALSRVVGNRWLRPIWVVGGVVLLIEIGHASLPDFIFPSSAEILSGLWSVLTEFNEHLLWTGVRVAYTLTSALLFGWVLGVLMVAWKPLGQVLQPYVKILLSTPALFWILVAVIWFYTIEIRVWFIAFILCMPFFAAAVFEALKNIDDEVAGGINQFGPSRLQNLKYMLVPYSTVTIFATTQSVSGYAFRIIVFAELVGAHTGVGVMMGRAQAQFRVEMLFAWAISLILLNFAFTFLMRLIEARVLRWRPPSVAT